MGGDGGIGTPEVGTYSGGYVLLKILRSMLKFSWVMMLGACGAFGSTCPTSTLATLEPSDADFLRSVWPPPNSTVTMDCYQASLTDSYPEGRGIGAVIIGHQVDVFLTEKHEVLIPARTQLRINGNQVSPDTLSIVDSTLQILIVEEGTMVPVADSGVYSMSWGPELAPGTHVAEIVIERDTGEILQYSWTFTIAGR